MHIRKMSLNSRNNPLSENRNEQCKFIIRNDAESTYEWYDNTNQQLTVYRITVDDFSVTINIYQSPILQNSDKAARDNLTWRTKVTHGKEYVRMLGMELNRISNQPVVD